MKAVKLVTSDPFEKCGEITEIVQHDNTIVLQTGDNTCQLWKVRPDKDFVILEEPIVKQEQSSYRPYKTPYGIVLYDTEKAGTEEEKDIFYFMNDSDTRTVSIKPEPQNKPSIIHPKFFETDYAIVTDYEVYLKDRVVEIDKQKFESSKQQRIHTDEPIWFKKRNKFHDIAYAYTKYGLRKMIYDDKLYELVCYVNNGMCITKHCTNGFMEYILHDTYEGTKRIMKPSNQADKMTNEKHRNTCIQYEYDTDKTLIQIHLITPKEYTQIKTHDLKHQQSHMRTQIIKETLYILNTEQNRITLINLKTAEMKSIKLKHKIETPPLHVSKFFIHQNHLYILMWHTYKYSLWYYGELEI